MLIEQLVSASEDALRTSSASENGMQPVVPLTASSLRILSLHSFGTRSSHQNTPEIELENSDNLANPLPENIQDRVLCNEIVLQQLTRILQSKRFIQSDKLCRFLRFVVEHTLDGDSNCLKEYLIGVEVYDRRPTYDPSQDSIVRTEARRLRSKLRVYYENEGKADPVHIYLLPGSYIPVVQLGVERFGPESCASFEATSSRRLPSVVTAILPFRDLSGNVISSTYARGIPDELAYVLMQTEGCTVITPTSLEYFNAREHDISATMVRAGARIAFEGSVRAEGSHLRVTARIIDATGVQLWTRRIDAEVGPGTSWALDEQIALALSDGFGFVCPRGV